MNRLDDRGTETGAHFVAHAAEFSAVLGAEPVFATLMQTNAHEGPVYVHDDQALYFTTTPVSSDAPIAGSKAVQVRRLRLDTTRFPYKVRADQVLPIAARVANGMTLDHEGRLLICEQGTRALPARISRLTLPDGALETLVDEWRGLRFNSPNDVVVKRDGSIWFTDPSYGALQGFKDAPMIGDYVYRFDPKTQQLSVVADDFNKPNGLAFSPDESILYINDSAAIQGPGSYFPNLPHHLRAFDVVDGRHLRNGRLFAVVTPGIPDGLKVDSEGHVYSSSASGLQVFNPGGELIGEICAPGVANFCFGGPERNVIFLMADPFIFQVRIAATG